MGFKYIVWIRVILLIRILGFMGVEGLSGTLLASRSECEQLWSSWKQNWKWISQKEDNESLVFESVRANLRGPCLHLIYQTCPGIKGWHDPKYFHTLVLFSLLEIIVFWIGVVFSLVIGTFGNVFARRAIMANLAAMRPYNFSFTSLVMTVSSITYRKSWAYYGSTVSRHSRAVLMQELYEM